MVDGAGGGLRPTMSIRDGGLGSAGSVPARAGFSWGCLRRHGNVQTHGN